MARIFLNHTHAQKKTEAADKYNHWQQDAKFGHVLIYFTLILQIKTVTLIPHYTGLSKLQQNYTTDYS